MSEPSRFQEATRIWGGDEGAAPPDAAEGAIPEKIGRYRALRLMGRGGFGSVFEAFDDELARPVAIKAPDPALLATPEDVERYVAEARVVASLDHPQIVPVYDIGSSPEFPCFVVSRLMPGGDLPAAREAFAGIDRLPSGTRTEDYFLTAILGARFDQPVDARTWFDPGLALVERSTKDRALRADVGDALAAILRRAPDDIGLLRRVAAQLGPAGVSFAAPSSNPEFWRQRAALFLGLENADEAAADFVTALRKFAASDLGSPARTATADAAADSADVLERVLDSLPGDLDVLQARDRRRARQN